MKNQSYRRNRGFTLVELLVVIAIIAVLASAGFAAGNAAIQKARKMTALSAATSIESAVNNFYTEYGSMPTDGDADSAASGVDLNSDTALLKVLLGVETGTNLKNSRSIKFLSVREGKNKKGGLSYSGNTVNGLYDPWGGSYKIVLDLDYDEVIKVKPQGAGSSERTLNGRRVAAWSDGADGVTGSGKVADDVITW